MYEKYFKRLFDIVISIILIIVLLPIMFLTAIVLLINLGLPISYEIKFREGKNKKIFIMYKLRTRKEYKHKSSNEATYTKISYMVDKLRLNELPQLFNVLKGDMSLVGPRPFIPGDTLPIGEISYKRYLLRPGLTGLAQINSPRTISHKKKLEYDIIYYDNLSFKNDLKIILKTFKVILK